MYFTYGNQLANSSVPSFFASIELTYRAIYVCQWLNVCMYVCMYVRMSYLQLAEHDIGGCLGLFELHLEGHKGVMQCMLRTNVGKSIHMYVCMYVV